MKSMYCLFMVAAIVLVSEGVFGQVKPKPKPQPSSGTVDINQMMEAEMKRMGLSEKEMQEMRDGMKMVQAIQEKGPVAEQGDLSVSLPRKQASLLAQMPSIGTKAELISYVGALLDNCRKTIPSATATAVDRMLQAYNDNLVAQANMAPVFLMQKSPSTAVYAALKLVAARPGNRLLLNNLGVILHQAGYAHKAIPILQFLALQQEDPLVLNTLGQSFLTLGDTARAKTFFARTLRLDPGQPEANCGMGLILSESGKVKEATPYIARSLKNGYSRTAESLMNKHNMRISFSDVRQKVPEYFNPNQFKPVEAAYETSEVLEREAEWSQLDALTQQWVRKRSAAGRKDADRVNQLAAKAEKDPAAAMALLSRGSGYVYNTPLNRKAQMMTRLISGERVDFERHRSLQQYETRGKELYQEMTVSLGKLHGAASMYEDCQQKTAVLDKYLKLSAENYDACVRGSVYKLYDWTNQSVYWQRLLLNDEQYETVWHGLVSGFFEGLMRYRSIQQLYPTPDYIALNCQNIQKPEKDSLLSDAESPDCPVSVKISLFVASYKMNCNGWEFEASDLVIFNVEKNYRSGELTVLLGAGANIDAGVMELGVKGQMFIKLDRDLSPVDIGVKGEAGGEISMLGVNVEDKANIVIGMTSGVNVGVNNHNTDVPIFSWSPVQ